MLGKTDLIFIVIEEDYVSSEGWLAEDCPVVEGFLKFEDGFVVFD